MLKHLKECCYRVTGTVQLDIMIYLDLVIILIISKTGLPLYSHLTAERFLLVVCKPNEGS